MKAYHWDECQRNSSRYNPPLEARYIVVAKRIKSGRRILDIGCGDGYLTSLVRSFAHQVVGVDTEPTAVLLAKSKLQQFPNCRVMQASCYELPFANRTFDIAILADVIEHLESPETCLKEITRVLAPNGTLLLTTPKRRSDRIWDRYHFKEYNPEELLACLQRYFSGVKVIFFCPIRWYKIYETRVGYKLMKPFSKYLYNPYLREGDDPKNYHQILAVCEQSRR